MPTVIILTDFSASSRNALNYACSFLPADTDFLLLNIHPMPFSYSGDGVALASLSEALSNNQNEIENELEWAVEKFPAHHIRYKEVMGEMLPTLEEQSAEESAILVVIGTPEDGGDSALVGTNMLDVLTDLTLPVLAIPNVVSYRPIKNIGFACKTETIHSFSAADKIEELLQYTQANLHVIRAVAPESNTETHQKDEAVLKEKLNNLNPQFHTVEGGNVIVNIEQFIEQYNIDLLLIRARKHGIWYRFLHKNYSKQLAALNVVPIMALH